MKPGPGSEPLETIRSWATNSWHRSLPIHFNMTAGPAIPIQPLLDCQQPHVSIVRWLLRYAQWLSIHCQEAAKISPSCTFPLKSTTKDMSCAIDPSTEPLLAVTT